jgi:hypothetical protein
MSTGIGVLESVVGALPSISLIIFLGLVGANQSWSFNCVVMARGRPHGRSKSDHRVCQAARHARAAEHRERIAISAEQQEAPIAAANAERNVEDAPRRRWGQKSKDPKTKASAARAQGHSSKATGSGKKKANKRLEHAHGKAAQRGEFLVHGFWVECFEL